MVSLSGLTSHRGEAGNETMKSVVRSLWPQLVRDPPRLEKDSAKPWKIIVAGEKPLFDAIRQGLSGLHIGGRKIEVIAEGGDDEMLLLHGNCAIVALAPDSLAGGRVAKIYLAAEAVETGRGLHPCEVFAALIEKVLHGERQLEGLRAQRFFDPLCNLPNRSLFVSILDKVLEQSRNWAVAIIDIDQFSSITNALGYSLGDTLLQAVAGRLQMALEASGHRIGRIGNDSFALLAPQEIFDQNAVFALFADPLKVNDYPLHVSITMGLVLAAEVQGNAETVLKCASTALKTGKHQLRGTCRRFAPTMAAELEERVQLAYDLKSALAGEAAECGGLEVHYQPQVDLADGRPVGVEALVRWRHPRLGMIMPDRFIFIAEQAGLIVDLGEFVLERACRDQCEWLAQGLPPLRMAVNVSMQQFRSSRFLPAVGRVLAETGIAVDCLELEITESMLMGDTQAVVATMREVKALGVKIAMDDFGTGYSSLSHLQILPIDRLKVDRSFVRDIEAGNAGARIAEMIVSLGRTLGIEIVAEGIERFEVVETLRQWGCHEGQGYYYGRPMPSSALTAWLLERRSLVLA
ncbi:MAG: GGDEF-domain containing protein [Proteobacteria bacterium]|nr:GGDEF-domain containing protein [Pseudomonadota bacterium]